MGEIGGSGFKPKGTRRFIHKRVSDNFFAIEALNSRRFFIENTRHLSPSYVWLLRGRRRFKKGRIMLKITVAIAALLNLSNVTSAADLDETFRACVQKETPIAIAASVKKLGETALYGYHADEIKAVISKCLPNQTYNKFDPIGIPVSPGTKFASQVLFATNAINAAFKKRLDEFMAASLLKERKQEEEYDRRKAADRKLLGDVADIYKQCMIKHVDVLATRTQESAEVLSVAILASCPAERSNLEKTYLSIKHTSYAHDFMRAFDKEAQSDIIFRIVAIRAASSVPAEPARPQKPTKNTNQL